MLAADEDALVCDMAETYHILDIWALPVELLAVLASGLRDNSRIRMKLAGYRYMATEFMLPQIVDILMALAVDKENRPTPLTEIMTNADKKEETIKPFDGDEFLMRWYGKTKEEVTHG